MTRSPMLALALFSGCATLGSYQTANTVGAGNMEGAVETSLWGFVGPGEVGALPHLAVSGRFGVSDRFDLGFRALSNGLDITGKYMFTEPGSEGVVLSLAPTVGGFMLGTNDSGAGIFNANLPLLVGFPVGDLGQVVLGPRVVLISAVVDSDSGALVLAGSSFGLNVRVGGVIQLMPEVTLLAAPAIIEQGLVFQSGLALGIGSKDR